MSYRDIFSSVKTYRRRGFVIRYGLYLFLPIFVVFSVYTFLLIDSYNSKAKQEKSTFASHSAEKISGATDDISSEADSFANYLALLNKTEIFLSSPAEQINSIASEITSIAELLREYTFVSKKVESIYFYSVKNKFVISSGIFNSSDISAFPDKSWNNSELNPEKAVSSRAVRTPYFRADYLTLIKPLYFNAKLDGIVVFNIRKEELAKLCAIYNNTNAVIADKNAQILYSSAAVTEKVQNLLRETKSGESFDENGYSYIFISETSGNKVALTFADSGNYPFGIIMSIGAFVLLIGVAFAFALFQTSKFYGILLKIMNAIISPGQAYRNGDSEEVSFIMKNIRFLTDRNSEIETQLDRLFQRLNKTRTETLQAQMTPHFLFNTLNLISAMELKEQKKDTDVSRTINALSEMLRSIMKNEDFLVPVMEEVEFTKKYVAIQTLRFQNKFDVIWEIAPDCAKYKILKLSVQPLVENAIIHGVLKSGRAGLITVKISAENARLVYSVSDTGDPLPPETLAEINNGINSTFSEDTHSLGLYGTGERIKLIYGDEGEISVFSDKNGTLVKVSIPIIKIV